MNQLFHYDKQIQHQWSRRQLVTSRANSLVREPEGEGIGVTFGFEFDVWSETRLRPDNDRGLLFAKNIKLYVNIVFYDFPDIMKD